MKQPVLVPATRKHVAHFYRDGKTRKAFVALLDGKPIGLGGLVYDGEQVSVFSIMTEELKPYRRFIMKCARKAAEMARECNACAVADPQHKNSKRLLEKIGAVYMGRTEQGEIYIWPGLE